MDKLTKMALYAEIEDSEDKFDKSYNLEERRKLERKIKKLKMMLSASSITEKLIKECIR
ncbi:hypothetical protein HDR60_02015 [bacterium]|nr:hypothetical protein [bacterium]